MLIISPDLLTVPRFGVAGWTVVLAVVAYLAVVAPLQGRRAFRRLRAARPTDPGALVALFRRNVSRKIGWLLPVALALRVVPGLRPAHLGLAWPHGPSAAQTTASSLNLVGILLITGLMYRRRPAGARRCWVARGRSWCCYWPAPCGVRAGSRCCSAWRPSRCRN